MSFKHTQLHVSFCLNQERKNDNDAVKFHKAELFLKQTARRLHSETSGTPLQGPVFEQLLGVVTTNSSILLCVRDAGI